MLNRRVTELNLYLKRTAMLLCSYQATAKFRRATQAEKAVRCDRICDAVVRENQEEVLISHSQDL
jgi:hypothetical protein